MSPTDRSSEEVVRVEADASFFRMSTVYPPVPSTPTGGPALISTPAMPVPAKTSVVMGMSGGCIKEGIYER